MIEVKDIFGNPLKEGDPVFIATGGHVPHLHPAIVHNFKERPRHYGSSEMVTEVTFKTVIRYEHPKFERQPDGRYIPKGTTVTLSFGYPKRCAGTTTGIVGVLLSKESMEDTFQGLSITEKDGKPFFNLK